MCRNENAFCKTTTTVFAISVAFQFQVGIVLMSILCHIWKIVPDLYEAITRITHTENETSNFTHLQNCSVREPVSDVSDIHLKIEAHSGEKSPTQVLFNFLSGLISSAPMWKII